MNDLHLLRNQETNEFPTTSAALPQDVFSMDDDDPTRYAVKSLDCYALFPDT